MKTSNVEPKKSDKETAAERIMRLEIQLILDSLRKNENSTGSDRT